MIQAVAHDGHRFGSAAFDLRQVVRQVRIGFQHSLAFVLDALDSHRDRAAFVVDSVQQVGRYVADRGEGKAVQNVATSSERIAQVLDLASAQYARDYSEATRPLR